MAEFLGVSQSQVARNEAAQKETGPVARLLDQLESALKSGVGRPGMSPSDAIAALSPTAPMSPSDESLSPFIPEAAE